MRNELCSFVWGKYENLDMNEKWNMLKELLLKLQQVYIPNIKVCCSSSLSGRVLMDHNSVRHIRMKHWKRYMETRDGRIYFLNTAGGK